MRFAITHNNFNPAGGGVLPPFKVGGKVQEQTKQSK